MVQVGAVLSVVVVCPNKIRTAACSFAYVIPIFVRFLTDVTLLGVCLSEHSVPLSARMIQECKVTDQKQTGRCWIFATLNVMRLGMLEKYSLGDDFELVRQRGRDGDGETTDREM